MAVKHVDLDDCYLPQTNSEKVVIDVEIGDGQEGSYSIFLGSKFIKANGPGKIGTKEQIQNKTTTVSVVIVDELEETNWTSISILVKEGQVKPKKFGPYSVRAENHLDTIVYTFKLVHK